MCKEFDDPQVFDDLKEISIGSTLIIQKSTVIPSLMVLLYTWKVGYLFHMEVQAAQLLSHCVLYILKAHIATTLHIYLLAAHFRKRAWI